jgi:hypothetical protein
MTNTTYPTQENKIICPVWEEQSKIGFNTYTSNSDKTEQKNFEEFAGDLETKLQGSKGIIVINGGHYIPSTTNSMQINRNSICTWNLACQTAKKLQDAKLDARVSLMINDLPLSPEERKAINYEIPAEYKQIAEGYGVEIINNSVDQTMPYSEKKGSNRFGQMEHSKCWQIYPMPMTEHCVNAIIFYLRDISKQGAQHSVFITPKCSHKNMIKALQLYSEYEGGIDNECYFETPNCFE